MPQAETLRHSGVEVLAQPAPVQSDLAVHLEPGWALERVFRISRERESDWALKGHSLDDQNRGSTE